mgnify:CR=1 FL=1
MEVILRQEVASDFDSVFGLIESAFKNEEYSDHSEQYLVQRLRNAPSFIPELSIVAEVDHLLVGHILLTPIKVKNESMDFDSLALAPVSVVPTFQGKGIGGKLIFKSHEIAEKLGHTSIILLGHSEYYPKFGYQVLDRFDITLPFDVAKENCMAIELIEDALAEVNGVVEYPAEFFD